MLNEILEKLNALPESEKAEIKSMALDATKDMLAIPNPGPQTMAYFSEADEVFYGGCVSGDTEFLTSSGWVRIDEYSGEEVAQWDNGTLSFVSPEYHQYQCSELIKFEHSRLSMVLSDEHRMPLYDWKGEFCVKKAVDVARKPSRHRVPVNFSVPHHGLNMSDDLIRLAVAIHADGNLTHRKKDGGAHGRITLRKQRKIDRLLWLFELLNISPSVYRNPNRPTEVRYGFDSPILTKHYVDDWWLASQHQLEIILDEMSYWDGDYSGVVGGDIGFSSTHKIDADFIQYAAHACNRVATISVTPPRDNAAALYNVFVSHEGNAKSTVTLRVDAIEITRVSAQEMYCFTTPSSFWLARHNNCVFVTGNSPGCGKSTLVCMLAANEHTNSLILRREYPQVKGLIKELRKMLGSNDGYNGQDKMWRIPNTNKEVEFGSCQYEEDKEKYQGREHDLKAFDEITAFTESQYTYIIGWNRSSDPNQRCRVICTGNPPRKPEGFWVIKRWAAWLDPTHRNPAKSGELRWYTTIDGVDTEVDGKGPYTIDGREVYARSRTFIPGFLEDNPDLLETGYASVIESMPEPMRTMMREGRFDMSMGDAAYQLIPTQWISLAQARWEPNPPDGVPQCAIGVDIAQGGGDRTVFAIRYDGWFDELVVHEGKDTPDGLTVAGHVIANRRDNSTVIVDMGGGYGGATYEQLTRNITNVMKYKGSESSSKRTKDGKLPFYNTRAEAYYRLKEALDPDQPGGSRICLPKDPEILSDLTSILIDISVDNVIKLESKKDLVKRLGRSPDKGDAIMMCWSGGDKIENSYQMWQNNRTNKSLGRRPVVKMNPRRR